MLKFFLIIVALPLVCTIGFPWYEDYNVDLVPNNPVTCTTQNITLTCVVKDLSQFNASDLTITVQGDANIQHSGIRVLNESAAAITLWNSTPNAYGTFCCKHKSKTGSRECQTLRTSDYPVPVTDFKCIVQDWSESMNCTWKPGTDYEIIPGLSIEWRYPYSSCGWISCPEYNKDYCYWNSTVGHDFSLKLLNFRVNLTAKCGVTINSYFTVNTKTAIQPAPMKNLQAEVLNSTCIKVTWEASRLEFVKIYEIWNTSRWSNILPSEPQLFMANDTGMVNHNEAVFCDLVPATLYTFTGRVKPGKKYWSSADNIHTACDKVNCSNTIGEDFECMINEGYWSEEKTISAATYGDIPSASPEVTPGGYWWDPKVCEKSESYRTVSFYWKLVKDIHQNGKIQGYDIRIDPSESKHRRSDLAGYANYETEKLRCDIDYFISIRPKNANGTSKEVSIIKIADSRKGIYPPSFRVEMSNITDERAREVHILWTAVSRADVTGFTVFWCKREQGQCANFIPDSGGDSTNDESKNEVHWKLVGPDENSTNLSILLPEDYLYSISMETKSGSSGMTWQSCIYTAGVAPKRAPTGVEIHTGTENRALLIHWKHLACLSGEPYINIYEIEYCVEGRCKDQKTMDNSIILRDLEAEMLYKVRVRGVSSLPGPWSEMVEKVPVDNSLKPGAIVAISFGALMGFIILLSCLMLTYKKCYIRIKKTVKKPITVPDVALHENKTYNPEENEDDSINEEGKQTPPYITQMSELSGESGFDEGGANSPDSNRSYTNGFFNNISKKEEFQPQPQLHPANDDYVRATEIIPKEPIVLHINMVTEVTKTDMVGRVVGDLGPPNENMPNVSQVSINPYVFAEPITSYDFNEQTDNMKRISDTEDDTNQGSTVGTYVKTTVSDSFGMEQSRSGNSSSDVPRDFNSEQYTSAASGANAGGSVTPDYFSCHMEDTEVESEISDYPDNSANEKNKMGNKNATATDYVKTEVQSGAFDQYQGYRKPDLSITSIVDHLDDSDLQPHYSSSSESERVGATSGRGLKLTDIKTSSDSGYVSQDFDNATERGFEEENTPDLQAVFGASHTVKRFNKTNDFENNTTGKTDSFGYFSKNLLNCPESYPDRPSQYLNNDMDPAVYENANITENDQHLDSKSKMHEESGLEEDTNSGYISEHCLIAKQLVDGAKISAFQPIKILENTENKHNDPSGLSEGGYISEAIAHDLETEQERLDIYAIEETTTSSNGGNNLLLDMPKDMPTSNGYVPHTFLEAQASPSDESVGSVSQDETGNVHMCSSSQADEREHNSGYVPHDFIEKL